MEKVLGCGTSGKMNKLGGVKDKRQRAAPVPTSTVRVFPCPKHRSYTSFNIYAE